MGNGFSKQTFLNERIRQTGVCARVIWMEGEGGSPLLNRAVNVALSKQGDPKVVVGIGKIRPQFNRLAKMTQRFIEPADAGQGIAGSIIEWSEMKVGVCFMA